MPVKFASAVMGAALLGITSASALDAVVTTGETYSGTIRTFDPTASTFVVSTDAAPVTYTYSPTTTFVDSTGAVVNYDTITPDMPVEIHYTMDGPTRVVDRVVVQKPVSTTTTTETTTIQKSDD